MNYINEMRKVIGHDLIMGVGCGVLIEDDKGRLLCKKEVIQEIGASQEEPLNQ